ncbi:MAG TPA: hypothetical protein IAC53_01405 [Candidatus Fimenecus excrementigallinarum]|uniref:Lasso RiPP family leader peptide-containing protein n=1 Tax=Candidatus Fimenecus excrementigallinarum TaxID=2840816 RepID=A0A9D1IEN4_9FIRM|nr:hypothetical protein [Candidatus Fimenecus excrementigallinarum]
MNKKAYETPLAEITVFETEDIITTSPGMGGEIELPDLDLDLFITP